MKLALRELVRRPGKFVTATIILTLIAILLMFLGGLLDGLIRNSTGAVRAQQGDALVYSESSQASFLRSRIEPTVRTEIEALPDVDAVGGLGVVQLGARVPGNGPRDLANVAVWGYELPPKGVPEPPPPGEAWADEVLKADGVELGDELLVGPSRTPIVVAGWVEDTVYNGQGSLWADIGTWRRVLAENRPDAVLADGIFQALVVQSSAEASTDVVAEINTSFGSTVEAFSIPDAVDAIPGVTEQQTTFNQILGVTVVIALVVIALFFALLDRRANQPLRRPQGDRRPIPDVDLRPRRPGGRPHLDRCRPRGRGGRRARPAHSSRFDPPLHLGGPDRDQHHPPPRRCRDRQRVLTPPDPPDRPGLCPRELTHDELTDHLDRTDRRRHGSGAADDRRAQGVSDG